MVKLRLKRIGKKQTPFYRIVAADSRVNRDGKYIELVGTFDPLKNETKIDQELVLKWLKNGAQPTDTVKVLFSREGIMKAYHESKVTKKVVAASEGKVAEKEVKKPTAKKTTKKAESK